jgi:hypothetical protein
MNLSNPAVVLVVLILLSSTVVIFFPLVSEQQQGELGSVLKLAKANIPIDIPLS